MAFPDVSTLRSYGGGALPSVLTGSGISATGTTFIVADASTWLENGTSNPLGTSGPFVVAIDYGETNEEKVLCSNLNLSNMTVTVYSSGGSIGRAYDNSNIALATTAGTGVTHATNAVVIPVYSSVEAQAANLVGTKTLGKVTAAGDLLVGDAAQSLKKLAAGASGTFLKSTGSDAAWSTIAASNLAGTGSTTGQALISTGSGTAPAWTTNYGQAYVSATAPSTTLSGALWWDTTNALLKVYNGGWIPTPGDSGWLSIATFTNSWASTSGIQYRKIGNMVRLRGQFTTAGTANTVAFQLPSGYRPTQSGRYAGMSAFSTQNTIIIDSSGNVTPGVAATSFLDGITFLID